MKFISKVCHPYFYSYFKCVYNLSIEWSFFFIPIFMILMTNFWNELHHYVFLSFCEIELIFYSSSGPMECVPNTQWKQDCNFCYCTSGGLPLCTLMGCHPKIKEIPTIEKRGITLSCLNTPLLLYVLFLFPILLVFTNIYWNIVICQYSYLSNDKSLQEVKNLVYHSLYVMISKYVYYSESLFSVSC